MSVRRAIVLAAGRGTRLGRGDKPLHRVAGAPLIAHVAHALERAGVSELVVVVGRRGDALRAAIHAATPGLEVTLVENARCESSANGVSLLAARAYLTEPCGLTMADHLFEDGLVARVLSAPGDRCVLGIDRHPRRCFDLDDATKVALRGDQVATIGKSLSRFDAVDTGMFRVTHEIIRALDEVVSERGDAGLSEGVQRLADAGRMQARDIGELRWIDVDSPAAARAARSWLG